MQPTPYVKRYDESWRVDQKTMAAARRRAHDRLIAAHPLVYERLWRSDPASGSKARRAYAKNRAKAQLAAQFPEEFEEYLGEERPRPRLTNTAAQIAARQRARQAATLRRDGSGRFLSAGPVEDAGPLSRFADDDPMRDWY